MKTLKTLLLIDRAAWAEEQDTSNRGSDPTLAAVWHSQDVYLPRYVLLLERRIEVSRRRWQLCKSQLKDRAYSFKCTRRKLCTLSKNALRGTHAPDLHVSVTKGSGFRLQAVSRTVPVLQLQITLTAHIALLHEISSRYLGCFADWPLQYKVVMMAGPEFSPVSRMLHGVGLPH